MAITTPTVRHNPAEQRFERGSEDALAVAEYQREGNRVIFTHTFVPPEMRTQGLAASLARTALDWARAEKLKVVAECSYIASFIKRHPEYHDLL